MSAPAQQLALAILALLSLSHGADAAGFTIDDQSARSLGSANAGSAAATEDAATIAYNPAAIIRLEKPEFTASATIANGALRFASAGSTLATAQPNLGRNDDGGTVAFLPNLFVASPLAPNLAVGLGMFPSFGLKTDYQRGWVGRYEAESTELTSLDFAPALAYRLAPELSVGGGPVARYSQAKLSSSIDFGSLGAALGIPGSIPGQTDGNVKIRGSDWSFGFNAGILIEPSPETRLGLAYFYNQAAKLSGAAEFERPEVGNVISAVSGGFVQTGAAARLAYPDRLNFGVVHAVSPALDVRAGLAWTLWHSLKELRIHFANPDQPDAVTKDNWRDQLAYAIGGTYKVDPAFVLRAGVSYDPTPVPDATHREPRIPDSDRLMLAIGAGYAWSDETRIDIAYEHIFNNTGSIDVSSPSGDRLSGKTRLSADIFALQLTLRY
jgi:long-chain fatty acid transport protein